MIYKKNNEILAFIKDSYGPEGIYLSGLIHPDVENTVLLLQSLFNCFPNLPLRPIYLEVRSYQSGIENSLEQLNCLPGPRQALMVKHIASLSNTKELSLTRKVLEKVRAEPTAPIIHHFITDNKKN